MRQLHFLTLSVILGLPHLNFFSFLLSSRYLSFDWWVTHDASATCLTEFAVALHIAERLPASLLIELILNRVVLESLVRRSLKVVGKGLQWGLQIVSVLNLGARVFIHRVVVIGEKVGQVAVVLVEDILRVSWLEHKPSLDPHKLLADGLVSLEEDRVSLLVAHKSLRCELNSKELFTEKAVYDASIRQISTQDEHH